MDDIENLKVADLKNELKRRGLPTGGNKSELLQRLQQHLLAEENQILQGGDSAATGEDVDDSLLDTNEDALLGITNETSKVKQQSTAKSAVAAPKIQISAGKIEAPKTSANVSPVKKLPSKSEAEGTTLPAVAPSSDQKQTVNLKEEIDVKDDEAKLRRAEKFKTGLSDEDKKLQRALKYGTGPATAPENSDVLAKKTRAERFGISINPSAVTDLEEKKKTRAERFGIKGDSSAEISSKPNGVAKVEASGNPAIPNSAENLELLKKRAERFGLSQTEIIQNLDEKNRLAIRKQKFVGIPSTPEIEAKKAKRAERFGV